MDGYEWPVITALTTALATVSSILWKTTRDDLVTCREQRAELDRESRDLAKTALDALKRFAGGKE